jgi:hypothetical protein
MLNCVDINLHLTSYVPMHCYGHKIIITMMQDTQRPTKPWTKSIHFTII